ncbi:hypothetical protein [Bacteriovorax sp. Seq25_V]|uniref:hypothetical protein n=1 Tax=Bacteriovorax sp. Seq25_V TaxID=1201288 RepID=UPI000416E6F6|nr:hypothetical protein [Bacteriovorax sp. Seq25_V]
MRKYITRVALSTILLTSVSTFALEEKNRNAEAGANKYFTNVFAKKYSDLFYDNIEKYNRNRTSVTHLSKLFKTEEDQALSREYFIKNKIRYLPPIVLKGTTAYLKYGSTKISFTEESLLMRTMYIDGKEVVFGQGNFKSRLEHFKTHLDQKVTTNILFEFLISSAVASGEKNFEHGIFAALVVLNENFEENSWCISCEDEYAEATEKNFNKIMSEVSRLANACENGESVDSIAYQIESSMPDREQSYLKLKMKQYFKDYDDSRLTCESFVKKISQDEINSQMKAINFRTGSLKEEFERENQQKYEKFVEGKCAPYIKLRNCLVNDSYAARDVYDKSRQEDGKPALRYREKVKDTKYHTEKNYRDQRK